MGGETGSELQGNAPKRSLAKQIVGDKLACSEQRASVAVGVADNPK